MKSDLLANDIRVTTPDGVVIVPPGAGQAWWVMNNHQLLKLTSADTRGGCALWIETVPPGEGPPPHLHQREEEIFVVLEGEVTFLAGDCPTTTGPGTVVLIPRGVVHTFRNSGGSTARMLILVTPGGFERYFEEVAFRGGTREFRPAPTADEADRLLAAAPRHALEFRRPAPPA